MNGLSGQTGDGFGAVRERAGGQNGQRRNRGAGYVRPSMHIDDRPRRLHKPRGKVEPCGL